MFSLPQLDPSTQSTSHSHSKLIPSFISNTLKHYLDQEFASTNGVPILKPCAVESFAVVVMADVSGYSKLSALLAEKGPIGAEILSKTMKGYLDKIIRIVLSHDGDIVKFAGDAVIIMWKAELKDSEGVVCTKDSAPTLPNKDKDGANVFLTNSACRCANCVKGETVLKGCVCCLELLHNLGKYRVNIEGCSVNELNIHLGIGAGQIFDIHVKGDEERWEHFIVGDPMLQLGTVLNLAKPEQLALSHASYQYLKRVVNSAIFSIGEYDKRCIILDGLKFMEEWNGVTSARKRRLAKEEVSVPVQMDEDHLQLYKKYINPSVLYKLHLEIEDFNTINELRQVTTIFIKLDMPSVAKGPDDFVASAQYAMNSVQRSMRRYEGILRQFHVDDKGAVMLCFFGLPPLAHDNDAYWAMRAAVDVRHAFRNGNIDHFAIGITTGTISIGGVGTEVRTEYALMGDSINLAARIMCQPLAKEDILCDDRTYSLCKKDFDLEHLGTCVVKGKSHPVDIYKPKDMLVRKKGLGSPTLEAAPAEEPVKMIGRDHEKSKLREIVERCRRGDQVRLVVEGEGGQGLTTLCSYLRDQAHERKVLIAVGPASEMDKTLPYNAFQDLICDILRHIESLPDIEARSLRTDGSSKSFGSNLGYVPDEPPKKIPISMTESGPLPFIRASTPSEEPNMTEIAEVHPVLSNSRYDLKQLRHVSLLMSTDQLSSIGFNKISRPRLTSSQMRPRGHTEEFKDTFEGHIKQGLHKAGEPTSQSGLFSLIFPTEFMDTDRTKHRMKELTDLVLRLINFLAHFQPVLLVITEAQWADQHSWNLVSEITENCPRVGFVVFSRPDKQYMNLSTASIYTTFKTNFRANTLNVIGLNNVDLAKLIMCYYADPEVTKVDTRLVEAVHRRSNGNCLHARGLILALKETKHFHVHDGVLKISQMTSDLDFDKIMPSSDLQSIVIAQFDRLHPHFQQLLKTAAVIGRDFLLDDVLHFMNVRHQITEEHIANFDKYGYIRKLSDPGNLYVYGFKSSIVRQCIYSMMMKPQQQLVHHYLAKYYEDSLDPSNRHRLLVRIYEHYRQSGSSTKARQYLAAVAHGYFEQRNIADAIVHYESLMGQVAHLQMDQLFATDSERLEWANWTRELGECHMLKGNADLAEQWLLKSLRCLGAQVPSTAFKMKMEITKQTFSSTTQSFLKRSLTRANPSTEGARLRATLLATANVFRSLQKYDSYHWAVFAGLSASDGFNDDALTAEFLAMAALIEWDRPNKRNQAWETLGKAEDICRSDKKPSMHNLAGIGSAQAEALHRAGHYEQAIVKYNAIIQYAGIISDPQQYANGLINLAWLHFIRMENNTSYEFARTLITKSDDEENIMFSIYGTCLVLMNLLYWEDGSQEVNVQNYYNVLCAHKELQLPHPLRYIHAATMVHAAFYLKQYDEINEYIPIVNSAMKLAENASWQCLIGHMIMTHWIFKLTGGAYDNTVKRTSIKSLDLIVKSLERYSVFDITTHMETALRTFRLLLTNCEKDAHNVVKVASLTADLTKMGCTMELMRRSLGLDSIAALRPSFSRGSSKGSRELAATAA